MMTDLKKRTGDFLIELGIFPSLIGFHYMLDAIDVIVENPKISGNDLYEIISIRHNANSAQVRRNIVYAVSTMSEDAKKKYFNFNHNSLFSYLSIIAWKVGNNDE